MVSPKRSRRISILDADFQKDVHTRTRSKTKAAEVEHAIRHFINLNLDEDPELFASFATELERILLEFKNNWDRIYDELEKLRQKNSRKRKGADLRAGPEKADANLPHVTSRTFARHAS